jgi:hypothetical protein
MERKELAGQQFGRLTAIKFVSGAKYSSWLCRCSCGVEVEVITAHLTNGCTKSCGCLNRDVARKNSTKHGLSYTSEYDCWVNMKDRCLNSKHKAYKYYGGRGIKVCDRWLNSFENFILDMGKKPAPELSLERIENDGNYEPGNCRWATSKEQRLNRSDVK